MSGLLGARNWPDSATPTLLIMLTAVCFGVVPVFARFLTAEGVSGPAIALYRYAFTLPLLLLFLPLSQAKWRSTLLLMATGFVMGLGWTGYLRALETVTVASAGVVYMTYPVFVVIFARMFAGQAISQRAVLATVLILAAALLAFTPGSLQPNAVLALLACLPAPIGFALVIVALSAMAANLSVLERLASVNVGAVTGLLPLVLWQDSAAIVPQTPTAWLLVAGLALITAAIPQLLYTFAAPRVGPSRSAAAGSLELPVMFCAGWLALGEAIGPSETLAAVMIIAAIACAPTIKMHHAPNRLP